MLVGRTKVVVVAWVRRWMADGSVGRTVPTGPARGCMGGVGQVYGIWVGECVGIIPAPLAYPSVDCRSKRITSPRYQVIIE